MAQFQRLLTFCNLVLIYGALSQETSCTEERTVVCVPDDVDPAAFPQDVDIVDDDKWLPGIEGFEFTTDGYVVALQGRVEWINATQMMGRGAIVIGEIPADFCPTYSAIFTATNRYGLIVSIEVTKELEQQSILQGHCEVILKSWSVSLLYFDPEQATFWYLDDIRMRENGQTSFNDLLVRHWDMDNPEESKQTNTNDTKEMSELFEINLDGITYVRSDAMVYTYDLPPNPTRAPTQSPVPTTRRRRLASFDESQPDPVANVQATRMALYSHFIATFPISTVVVHGACMGIVLFVFQTVLQLSRTKASSK